MRRISSEERRARLGRRHRLAARTSSVEEAARSLIGLHATDPATVFLSAWARVDGLTPADVEDALYERRTVVRLLAMRKTMFVVPVELLAQRVVTAGHAQLAAVGAFQPPPARPLVDRGRPHAGRDEISP